MPVPLAAALAYAQAGIPVLPLHTALLEEGWCSCRRLSCDRAGKHPRWHPDLITAGLHQASTDPGQIRAWWSAWPTANIGLRTGIVCDVCDIDSAVGLRSVLRLLGGTAPGPVVRTGSGGWHLYVGTTGTGNRVGLLPGVDWRGAGGYVVAPPSLHASGERYHWARPLVGAFPACPPALRELLVEAEYVPPAGATTKPVTVHHPDRYGAAALDAEELRVRTAPIGQRNHTLNRAAFSLGQLVGAGILTEHEVTAVLTDAALVVGLGRGETARTIRSGLTAGRRRPRGWEAVA